MRCEDEKMFYRPPLLEEPCAQTLSGKMAEVYLQKRTPLIIIQRNTETAGITWEEQAQGCGSQIAGVSERRGLGWNTER